MPRISFFLFSFQYRIIDFVPFLLPSLSILLLLASIGQKGEKQWLQPEEKERIENHQAIVISIKHGVLDATCPRG